MPFCTQCGTQVNVEDRFCPSCGSAQAAARPAQSIPRKKELFESVTPQTASVLCYLPIVGWIPCIFVLAADRFHDEKMTRFHAFQGLYLYVAWLILDWGLAPFLHLLPSAIFPVSVALLLKGLIVAAWIFMLIKTGQHETYRLPLFGGLAERSLSEQR